MPTLEIATAHVRRAHTVPFSRSDPRLGIQIRGARGTVVLRKWLARWPNANRAELQTRRQIWIDGARGAAEWDWTPPSGGAIKVLVSAFFTTGLGASTWAIEMGISELRSSDA